MEKDSIIFLNSVEEILPAELEGFFIGWQNPPSSETLLQILRNSEHYVIAYNRRSKKVMGFVNCISDGLLSAYVPLLEVLPEYQHSGIGSELMKRMLKLTKDYYMVDLCCDESLTPFYEKLGMKKTAGMIKRNYDNQSGK